MKKQLAVLTIALLASSFLLTSCHDDIYYYINQEVAIESNGIQGSINSIVRYKDNLYTQNGKVYRKTAKSSTETGLYNKQWEVVGDTADSSSPLYNCYVSHLASDSNYLYAMAITWKETDDGEMAAATRSIYYYDGTTWTKMPAATLNALLGSSDTAGTTDIKTIFYNKAVSASNRHAYARLYSTTESACHVYLLNGGNTPTIVTDGTNGAGLSSISAVYYKSADYFSNYGALAANDTYIYYANDSTTVYYATGYSSGYTNSGSIDLSDYTGSVYSICPTKDYLLLGTSTGIAHVSLNSSNEPASSTSSFSNNAATTLSSSYAVFQVLALDPTANEYETDLYGTTEHSGSFSSSTSALAEDLGLWAYYPGRGTWNKDGTADDASNGN